MNDYSAIFDRQGVENTAESKGRYRHEVFHNMQELLSLESFKKNVNEPKK